jgi:hypothetical protein
MGLCLGKTTYTDKNDLILTKIKRSSQNFRLNNYFKEFLMMPGTQSRSKLFSVVDPQGELDGDFARP